MKRETILIGGVVALLILSGVARATTWYVHPDSALNSIQAGIDSCSTGDTVLVGPGIYYEHIVWQNTQGIDLISQNGADTTIIDGDDWGYIIDINFEVDTTTIIDGFTIQNGAVGIHLYGASPTIIDNLITDNEHSDIGPIFGGGIICYGNASPIIIGNAITNNTVDGLAADGGGIACWENSAPYITNNTITGNVCNGGLGAGGGGISCVLSSSPIIIGNIICNNSVDALSCSGGGIRCFESSPTIDNNTISNNSGGGISCGSMSSPIIHYNNINDNIGYGLENTDSTITIDATNNWWGDATGPYHPTTNPGGLGDTVSDYVDFDPWLSVGVQEHEPIQRVTTTLKIFPNPFRHRTNIRYTIPEAVDSRQKSVVSMKIYNTTGRLVKTFPVPSSYSLVPSVISWDGRDDQNRMLSSGVYFLKLRAGQYIETRKLLFIK